MASKATKIEMDDEGELSPQTMKDIKKSLEDIKAGRIYSMEEVKKKLGIKS